MRSGGLGTTEGDIINAARVVAGSRMIGGDRLECDQSTMVTVTIGHGLVRISGLPIEATLMPTGNTHMRPQRKGRPRRQRRRCQQQRTEANWACYPCRTPISNMVVGMQQIFPTEAVMDLEVSN